MEKLVNEIIETTYNKLNDVNFPFGRFGLIVKYHGIKYKFLLNIVENSDKLIALGSGALSIDSDWDRFRPRFSRWSWDFNESTINYDDPTLYINDEILSAWCIGNKKNWFLKDIAEIIEIVSNKLNVKRNNLIFTGSSAGGFTSLMLSILVKGSISISEIPQFDITHWGSAYHWKCVKKHCFKFQSEKQILSENSYRFKVLELIKKEMYIPNAYIICSMDDMDIILNQVTPFLADLSQILYFTEQNFINFRFHGKTSKHNVLSKEDFLSIFNEIVSSLPQTSDKDSNKFSSQKKDIKSIEMINNEIESELKTYPENILYYDDFKTMDRTNNYYINVEGGSSFTNLESTIKFVNGSSSQYIRLKPSIISIYNLRNVKIEFNVDCIFENGHIRLLIFEEVNGKYNFISGDWISKNGETSISKKISSNATDVIFHIDTSHIKEGDEIEFKKFEIKKI